MIDEEVVKLYNKGHSGIQLSKQFGCSSGTIYSTLRRNDVKIRTNQEAKIIANAKSFPISKELIECLEGELLGDGHLISGGYQSALRIRTTCEEYRDLWIKNCEDNNIPLTPKGVYQEIVTPKTTAHIMRTVRSVEFRNLRQKWYPNGIKIIPEDIEISPNLMLYWWLGDGSLRNDRTAGVFCSECFTKPDQEMIIEKINNAIGIWCVLHKQTNKFRIFVPSQHFDKLLSYMGSSPLQSMEYKWNRREPKRVAKHYIDMEEFETLYLNHPRSYLAKLYGCSPNYISGLASTNNIIKDSSKKPIKSIIWDHENDVLKLYHSGITITEISSRYGTSRATVRKLLKRRGVK